MCVDYIFIPKQLLCELLVPITLYSTYNFLNSCAESYVV